MVEIVSLLVRVNPFIKMIIPANEFDVGGFKEIELCKIFFALGYLLRNAQRIYLASILEAPPYEFPSGEGRRLNGYRLACRSILDESPWARPIWWALKKMKDARSTSEVVTIALRLHRRLQ
jgi:hypothetical protein